jgi:hypothetical protein
MNYYRARMQRLSWQRETVDVNDEGPEYRNRYLERHKRDDERPAIQRTKQKAVRLHREPAHRFADLDPRDPHHQLAGADLTVPHGTKLKRKHLK